MRRILQVILLKPVLWAASRFASKPDRKRIFNALAQLHEHIQEEPGKKGPVIEIDPRRDRIIIFSDQHRGAKNWADDFKDAETNYLAALAYYEERKFGFISLGDAEELWENSLGNVKKHNTVSFEAEKKFIRRGAYWKVFGNHDLYWSNDPFAPWQLKRIYDEEVPVYEGVLLSTRVNQVPFRFFLTHGHQGDKSSDGNWFSKFFVARIWAPLQAYLRINPNTPAYDLQMKTEHNRIMYEWSAGQKNLCLITGHTHQPVFESLTHLERLHRDLMAARAQGDGPRSTQLEEEIRKRQKEYRAVSVDFLSMKPGYFNSGCCCFSDGDITGIEIADGLIRLVKWEEEKGASVRKVLEEKNIEELQAALA